jgi:hypothetical protein
MDKTHLQNKNIFIVLETRRKSYFEKNEDTKFTPKYKNLEYFRNFKISLVARNGRWLVENWPADAV